MKANLESMLNRAVWSVILRMYPISIRPAVKQDLNTIVEILEEAAIWLPSRNIRQWFPNEFRDRADEFLQFIADHEMYLGWIGGVPIGQSSRDCSLVAGHRSLGSIV